MKAIVTALFLFAAAHAGVTAGSNFPSLILEDQFEKKHKVTAEDTIVMMSFERDVSSAVNDFLNAQPKGFLAANNAKYVSDISAMPGIITKMFALPKMRDYNYALMLNYEDEFAAKFDKQEGKLTVYRLNAGVVEAVEFIDPAKVNELFSK
ncbi:MAG: hypothetical protein R3302_09345 [Sulfurimonadaceae bacterium]|nr:hypothetical protein [Sulfurimonadaceae bacterium]